MSTAEIEVDEPDDFIAGIQDQVNEFLDLLEEEMPDDNVPIEETDEEIIELKDIVVVESQKDDGHVEEISQEDFESADVVALEIPEEILSVEYLAYDDESTQTIDLEAIEDNALVGDMSKENLDSKFVPEKQIEKKAFARGTPRRARRSSRHGFVLAGGFVLLIAVVFSGWFYFKPKPVPVVLPSKPEPAGIARERAPSEDAAARQDSRIVVSPQPPVGQALQAESKADIQIPETQPPRETEIDQSLQPQSQAVGKPHSDMSEAEAPAVQNKDNLPEPSAVKTPAEKIVSPGETFETGRAYFTIQVASFATKPFAESSLKRLKQKGYPAYLVVKENADSSVLYKLRVGKYKTLNQARTVAESWHDSQIKSYIIVQSKDDISL